jgi:hypothetical protein
MQKPDNNLYWTVKEAAEFKIWITIFLEWNLSFLNDSEKNNDMTTIEIKRV